MKITVPRAVVAAVAAVAAVSLGTSIAGGTTSAARPHEQQSHSTRTPIKHVVVIFDENVSYDHYFGTYPKAANTDGTKFHAPKRAPRTDGLTKKLLKHNPNAYNPVRLSPSQALTCDQDHAYGPEQLANHKNKNDKFVEYTNNSACTDPQFSAPGLVMDYYDGNTVTALWNYAKKYTMSDKYFGTTFGPSSPGAINLVSGQTHGIRSVDSVTLKQTPTPDSYAVQSPDENGVGTMINDPDPAFDDCSDADHTSTNALGAMSGKNIGDLLNESKTTWGWFQGGFRPTTKWDGVKGHFAKCDATHANVGGASSVDYSPHHSAFQYYKSTSNRHHLPPSSVAKIGKTDQANHNYDLTDFDKALSTGHLPAVSFVKAAEYQDGHAGYSDPLGEQDFLVKQINAIQKSKEWKSTAIVVTYDDSDGWYDHAPSKILNGSDDTTQDSTLCQKAATRVGMKNGQQDRCGPGPRLPLLVISPYARANHVSHQRLEQTSVLKFIENNWGVGRVGAGSFDARAQTIQSLFDFGRRHGKQVILNKDGSVKKVSRVTLNR